MLVPAHSGPVSRRLRLAFVVDCIQDWRQGGTEKQIAVMVKSLNGRLFEPAVFVIQPSEGARAQIGCPIFMVNEGVHQPRLRSLRNLRSALERFQPDIVQTFFIDSTFYGALAAWLNGVPVIVQSRRNAGHWQKSYHTLALNLVNCVVKSWQCNSRCVAEMIRKGERIPADRIEVLYNAIDTDYFRPVTPENRLATRQSLALELNAPIFVAVSAFRPVKGLNVILDAAKKVRQELPKAQFLILGDGVQRKELADQIMRDQLHDMVRLLGTQADVRPWLAAADAGLLASFSESSSNALMEYMSMGLPAIVSDIPANRELVQEVYFAAGNSTELAQRIVWLWEHPEVRERIAVAYRRSALQYGELPFSEHLERYYLGLAAKYVRETRA